jgi:DNA-binding NarL/FixJ family response regulator
MIARLYVVEDDFKVAVGILRTLSSQKDFVVVGAAGTLAQARQELPAARPDIVLVDLQLPDGDGATLIRELRADRPEVVVLVFTIFGDEAPVLRAIESGADGYLLKGSSNEELVAALQQARAGESPISPAIARHLLKRLRRPDPPREAEPFDATASLAPERLSPREVEVLRLVAQGFVADEIGTRLDISVNTVRTHIRNVYGKLRVNHQGHAVSAAHRLGYL